MLIPIIGLKCSHVGHMFHFEGKVYRCSRCGSFRFSKHKPGRLRPSKLYDYVCSAKAPGCMGSARHRMPGLRAGGLRAWSCGNPACTRELTPKSQQSSSAA